MKTPLRMSPFLSLALVVLLGGVYLLPELSARIGERRATIEGRLLHRELGKIVPGDRAEQLMSRAPYHRGLSIPRETGAPFYASGELVIYFKSDEPGREKVDEISGNRFPPGWFFHVFYVNGSSVLECYQRNGRDLSEFERNAILGLNRGDSTWKAVEEEDQKTTFFGYDFELESGRVRAKVGRNTLLVFQTSLDEAIYHRRGAQAAFERRDAEARTPASITGF